VLLDKLPHSRCCGGVEQVIAGFDRNRCPGATPDRGHHQPNTRGKTGSDGTGEDVPSAHCGADRDWKRRDARHLGIRCRTVEDRHPVSA
jgi:hypothetical protein